MHTLLLLIAVLCYILYSTSDIEAPNAFAALKPVVYILLLLLSIVNIFKSIKYWNREYVYTGILFGVIVFIHYLLGNGTFEGCFVSLLVFTLISTLPFISFDIRKLAVLLLFIYISSFLLFPKDFYQSIFSQDYAAGWKVLFNNANMASVFICSVFAAVWLFLTSKKLRIITFVLVLIGLLACKSRNAILFFLLANIALYFRSYLGSRQRYLPLLTLIFLSFSLYYMIEIEPYLYNASNFSMFGKTEGSTGRALQILYVIEKFDINLWGYDGLINESTIDALNYPVHNFYVSTLYSMGLVYLLFYFVFIFRFYLKLKSYESKVFLLCFHVYFFFEPSWAFCIQLNYLLPMIIIACSMKTRMNQNE